MTRFRFLSLLFVVFLAYSASSLSVSAQHAPTEVINVPGFGPVTIYTPKGTPESVVLFVSGDGGWNKGVVAMAERLRDSGALVAGIDIRVLFKTLDSGSSCGYPAGQLEELARSLQLRRRLPEYKRPILVGYSSGATLVYATLAAAPPETFAGGISLGFCPLIEIHQSLCQMRGLSSAKHPKAVGFDLAPFKDLAVPWIVLHGEADQVCSAETTKAFTAATGHTSLVSLPSVGHGFGVPRNWEPQFVRAYKTIASAPSTDATSRAPEIADLSVVEVPARAASPDSDTLAIVLTGDGGWAEIDKSIATGLAARGVPSIGWSSLRYYWTPRTPDAAAADLARLLRHYLAVWHKSRALVVGYSFGADVAPYAVSRLPPDLASRIRGIGLLGLSDAASFEFHMTSWVGVKTGPQWPTAPEIRRLTVPITCVMGETETDSGCRAIAGPHVSVQTVGRGHHFSGEYDRIVDLILRQGS